MHTNNRNRRQSNTEHVRLDTGSCTACWTCIARCPENVIGRVNLPWHRHARILRGADCIGCQACVDACATDAFTAIQV